MVGVWGWLGLFFLVGFFFPPIFFFFFLVLHWNTLQQRNWKSCLKVGHSSAVSIETSSQRAVRFTSTGGAFACRDGLQPVVPVDPGPPQYPAGGTERGDTAQADQGMTKGNAPLSKAAPPGGKWGLSESPHAAGKCHLVPPYSHGAQSSDSPKDWHNFHAEI